jgi:hypothetical protein
LYLPGLHGNNIFFYFGKSEWLQSYNFNVKVYAKLPKSFENI